MMNISNISNITNISNTGNYIDDRINFMILMVIISILLSSVWVCWLLCFITHYIIYCCYKFNQRIINNDNDNDNYQNSKIKYFYDICFATCNTPTLTKVIVVGLSVDIDNPT